MVMATYSIVRATLNSEEVDQQCVARCVLKLFCFHLQRLSIFKGDLLVSFTTIYFDLSISLMSLSAPMPLLCPFHHQEVFLHQSSQDK